MPRITKLVNKKQIIPIDDIAGISQINFTSSFDHIFNPRELETADTLEKSIIHKRRPRRKNFSALKQERLQDVVTQIPEPGESYHIISNGKYDFWSFIAPVINYLGGKVDFLYGSTWTMNRNNVVALFGLFDSKKIDSINILTGTYFKRRESAVYATLAQGMIERSQKFIAFENHAKVLLLQAGENFISIEGSANFTANPRVENYCMSNDKKLLEFHRVWMESMLG